MQLRSLARRGGAVLALGSLAALGVPALAAAAPGGNGGGGAGGSHGTGGNGASGGTAGSSARPGTVTVDGVSFDAAPDTDAHVSGCVFQVDFAGFGEGDLVAGVTFSGRPPTGPAVSLLNDSVAVGEDGAGGATDVDAERTYDLGGWLGALGAPHPKQGYHVTLTVTADGWSGQGAKHKVFWVTDCEPGSPNES
jgi:hypothetical protein